MTNNQESSGKFNLQSELKRRQREERDRQIQQRQSAKLQGIAPTGPKALPLQAATPVNAMKSPAAVNAASQPKLTVAPEALPKQPTIRFERFQNLPKQKKIMLSAISAIALVIFVTVGALMMVGSATAEKSAPEFAEIPMSDADKVVQRFQEIGIPLSDLKPYDLSSATGWQGANAGYQFTVKRGKDQGKFILLSYETVEKAKADVFQAMSDSKYKKWDIVLMANIVMASTPATAQSIDSEMSSHFMQFLFAPYRAFWPTATAIPSATQLASATAPANGK